MITCKCPSCDASQDFEDKFADHTASCKFCSAKFTILSQDKKDNRINWNIIAISAIIIWIVYNWSWLAGDTNEGDKYIDGNSNTDSTREIPTPIKNKTKERIPASFYRAYAEGYGMASQDRERAILLMTSLINDPDISVEAKYLTSLILEGIYDSSIGSPMKYEIEY